MKKIRIMFLLVVIIFMTNVQFSWSGELYLDNKGSTKFLTKEKLKHNDNIIEVKIVNKSEIMNHEPLLVRAKVYANIRKDNISLARIVSSTYKNYTLIIKKDLRVGKYITGYLYKNLFAISSEGGGLR